MSESQDQSKHSRELRTPGAAPPDNSGAFKELRKPLRETSPVLAHLRSVLITGLLTAIPLVITIYVIGFLYGLVTEYTKGPANWIVEQFLSPMLHDHITPENLKTITSPVVAVFISLLIMYLLGLLGTFFIGRQILAQFEQIIGNLPLIKGIYGTTKQVMGMFRRGGGTAGFQRVVLVEFPRKGIWSIAFVTNTMRVADGAGDGKLVCCFIPLTPNPTSGFFQLFPEDQLRNTDWTVDIGIKLVLSGGLLAPQNPEALHDVAPSAEAMTSPQDEKTAGE